MKNLYVPLMNGDITPSNRKDYLDQLASLPVKRIFIALEREVLFARGEKRVAHLSALRENVAAFRAAGYDVGVWLQAFGFGNPLSKAEKEIARDYTVLRSVTGKKKPGHDAFCPESKAFVQDYLALIRDLAGVGTDMLMLDDDLCLSVRPGIGCFCQHHIALLEQALGESLAGADLPRLFFTGGENRYRSAWLQVMGDTLRRFARAVRETVDTVAPTLRVGFCAGYTSWDIEGVDAVELTRILAGDTAPFLRFTGAPYWAAKAVDRFQGMSLAAIIEEARAQERFCRDSGVEVFTEGDTYPRPRYAVSSSMLECFSLACHASGGMGELAYLFDYYSSPRYETGYLRHRLYNAPLYDFVQQHLAPLPPYGVRVLHEMRKIAKATLPSEVSEKPIMRGHFNRGAELLAIHGIPTTYDSAPAAIAFGEEARYLETLPKKLILDHRAAQILKERGFDVGLLSSTPAAVPQFERFGAERVLLTFGGDKGYHRLTLSPNALIQSEFEAEDGLIASSYTYKSGDCELLVLGFDADALPHTAATLCSYARAAQLRAFLPPLPYIKNAPGLYQLCKVDGNTLAMLFVNINEDPIFDGEILLPHSCCNLTLCGAEGSLQGNKILLSAPIPPYGAFAATIKMKGNTYVD